MTLLWSVISNLIANLIIAGTVAAMVIGTSFWKFSGAGRWLRLRFIPQRPDSRVLVTALPTGQPVHINHSSPFLSPLTELEREELVAFYVFLNRARVWNGPVVRLDALHPGIEVSVVGFHDLITTNLTAYPDNIPIRGVARRIAALRRWLLMRDIINKVTPHARRSEQRPPSVGAVLARRAMANPVAVSFLVEDRHGLLLIVKRSAHVAVASGRFGASCAGTVSESDLDSPDPFEYAAHRELLEETGVAGATVKGRELLIPLQKMQPVVALAGHFDGAWAEQAARFAAAPDAVHEAGGFYTLDPSDLAGVVAFLRAGKCSEVLAAQIWAYACGQHGETKVAAAWARAKRRLTTGGWEDHLHKVL